MNIHVLKVNSLLIPRGLYTDWMGNALSDVNANQLISEGAAILTSISSPYSGLSGALSNESASRNLTSSDNNKTLVVTNASATTFTIPIDATAGWQDGAFISLYQAGAGSPAFAAGSGVTLRNPNSVAASQYGFIAAQRVGPNEWAVL